MDSFKEALKFSGTVLAAVAGILIAVIWVALISALVKAIL